MRPLLSVRRLAPVAAALLATGCVNLDPQPDPTRYYVIGAVDADLPELPADCSRTILIGPVRVVGYADQAALVERRGAHQVVPLTLHRWAEPPSQALPRALVRRLSAAMPETCFLAYERATPREGNLQVEVEIVRFELTEGNEARVLLHWRAFQPGTDSPGTIGQAAATAPFEPGTDRVAAGISALSAALNDAIGAMTPALKTL